MNLTEFFDPIEDAAPAKFDEIGDAVEGTIAKEPEWQDDKFHSGEQVLVIILSTATGYVRVYARKSQLTAIGRELTRKAVKHLTPGAWLRLEYASDRETANGNSAKVWRAAFEPADQGSDGPIGTAELVDADEAVPF